MRCHRCDNRAAIRMRQHRINLCREHYLEWFVAQTQRFIEKYAMFTRSERLLLAVSGGKDSLALWDVLGRLGYNVDGLYINLGIDSADDYSNESQRLTEIFARERGMNLHVVNVAGEYGESVPQMAQRIGRRLRTCSTCGLVKRHEMNRIATDGGYDVLLTAHNLDDETAFLMANTFSWSTDLLARQYPVLKEAPGFTRKAKPFCRFYERETAAYALLRGIEYIEEECPYAVGAKQLEYKALINRFEEEKPGFKLHFYVGFLKARDSGAIRSNEQEAGNLETQRCPVCGQPTTAQDACAFCRLVNRR